MDRSAMDVFLTIALPLKKVADDHDGLAFEVPNAGGPTSLVEVLHEPGVAQGTSTLAGGTIHHLALNTGNEENQLALRAHIEGLGFTFPGILSRVVYGSGILAQIGTEIERLGRSKPLVLSTPHQEPEAQALADTLGAGLFAGAVMHTPAEVTLQALAAFDGCDCVVSLGGGSTIGLGKAIALRTGADPAVIPTTYAGSEMTDILGQTEAGAKTTRRGPAISPEVVVCDVDLTPHASGGGRGPAPQPPGYLRPKE